MEVANIEASINQLRELWTIANPVNVQQLTTGLNNASYEVNAGNGSFVAKRYLDAHSAEGHAFEHELLGALAKTNLPFAAPSLIPTRVGNSMAQATDGSFLILMPRISGEPAGRGDTTLTESAGRAFAMLDRAMQELDLSQLPPPPVTFGILANDQPNASSSTKSLLEGYPAPDLEEAIAETIGNADLRWREATDGIPRQIIHADCFPPNVLHVGETVTAIIDFEFAGLGHWAMDFAIGLVAFGSPRQTFSPIPHLLDAFAEGYLHTAALADNELQAVPALILMREATSFIHWLARLETGQVSSDEMVERGHRLLAVNAWLSEFDDTLIDRLHSIQSTPNASRAKRFSQ